MALIGNQGLNLQFYDLLPIPIEIFSSDGTTVFINKAGLEMTGCKDAGLIVGKYNLKNDPVCLKIIGKEIIDRIFRGEAASFPDFPAPVQDLVDRGIIDEKPWEAAIMDLFMLPIWDGDIFVYTVCFFTVKNMYRGRIDIIKAQEYIDNHYQDEFDLGKIAQSANLCKRHFQRIFKEVAHITPFEYYQKIRIERIKEKLLDSKLSVEQVFAECGVDCHGSYFKLFKEKTGKTSAGYRKEKGIK